MAKYACVNKGAQMTVWDTSVVSERVKIGTIYVNEAYVVVGEEGSYCAIQFRNSSGSLAIGILDDPSSNQLTRMSEYPFGTATVDGYSQEVFKMRRSETIYRKDGSTWGSVASGRRVVVNPDVCGDNMHYCCKITYVENTSGLWVPVTSGTGALNAYGFLDMGLSDGSTSSTISMYGSW